MNAHELPNAHRLRPQKPSEADTPHVTIETNTTCNIRCRACYAIEHPMVKSLDAIRAEIDYACSRRKLDTVSLLGGEPTLHPDLPEVVRDVKRRGLVCQVLTNGVLYLRDGDREVYRRLVDAGVDRFLVHLDAGQAHVHGDIPAARERMFTMLDELGVWYGLSLTLYAGEEATLPAILRAAAPHPRFDGVLVTLAMDFGRALTGETPRLAEPDMGKIAAAMHTDLGVDPSAYLPTNRDDDEVAWLMWFYWLNVRTGATAALSPELNRAMKAIYRATHDHEFFAETMEPGQVGRTFAAACAAELAIHPTRVRELWRVAREADGGDALRLHYAVVQQAPRLGPDGHVHFCWHCPDATVRNGRLVPVCLAGRVDPMGDRPPSAPEEVRAEVLGHLEEPPESR